jgi:hypothetical protein
MGGAKGTRTPDLLLAIDNPLLRISGRERDKRSPTCLCPRGNGPIGKQPVIRLRPASGEVVGPGTVVRIGPSRRRVLS